MPASCRKTCYLITFLLGCAACFYGWNSGYGQGRLPQREQDSLRFVIGRHLFFEKRLSVTHTKSCASCHNPDLAFTDGYRQSPGILADLHFRNTPTLINISRQKYFNWANPDVVSLEQQMEGPLFGTRPLEMGLSRSDTSVLVTLAEDPLYLTALLRLYPEQGPRFTWEELMQYLTVYLKELKSFASPYDRYKNGDVSAISTSAKRGEKLFFSQAYQCATCHKPPLFGADSMMGAGDQFANIGLYNHNGGNYPTGDQGLFNITGNPADKGKFKIPTLRNLQYTAPYFHDGSAQDLNEALAVFEQGGRNVTYGRWQGDGRKNPFKSTQIAPIAMTVRDKQDLLDFLQTLNDTTILSQNRFRIPYEEISRNDE